jgi:hypothetical protein
VFAAAAAASAPPKHPPEELVGAYTLNKRIPLEFFYVDDTAGGQGTHFEYSAAVVESLVKTANSTKRMVTNAVDMWELSKMDVVEEAKHAPASWWLYIAMVLHEDSIADKAAVVFGSTDPSIEAVVAAFNAKQIYTLEYNNLTFHVPPSVPPMTTINRHGFDAFYAAHKGKIDAAVSISTFEHDGLGRYGDPLHPDADLDAMHRVLSLLRPGGLLFLTVPIGPDVVVFNLHRRYGTIRLPLLLHGWEVVDQIGWDERKLHEKASWRQSFEPVFVLRKPLDKKPSDSGAEHPADVFDEL